MKDYKNYFLVYSLNDKGVYSAAIIPASFTVKVEVLADKFVSLTLSDNDNEFLLMNMITMSKEFIDYFKNKKSDLVELVTLYLLEEFKKFLDSKKSDSGEEVDVINFDLVCESIYNKLMDEYAFMLECDKMRNQ